MVFTSNRSDYRILKAILNIQIYNMQYIEYAIFNIQLCSVFLIKRLCPDFFLIFVNNLTRFILYSFYHRKELDATIQTNLLFTSHRVH